MRVDQEQAQVVARLEDLAQDERDAGRLADAGGAEHGEMLAHHVVDIDVGIDARVLLQGPDVDPPRRRDVVDELKLVMSQEIGGVADQRVLGHAALEERLAVVLPLDLAEKIQLTDGMVGEIVPGRGSRRGDLGDHADQEGGSGTDREELADSRVGVRGRAIPARDVEAHARLRAVDRNDPSERHGGSDARGVFVQLDRFQAGLPRSILKMVAARTAAWGERS